jgi:hypothetical protein
MKIGLLLLFLAAACTHARSRCEPIPIGPGARVIPLAEASSVSTHMSVAEIAARLGPARDERCSGLYCAEWAIEDGRILVVTYSDPCGVPIAVSMLPN